MSIPMNWLIKTRQLELLESLGRFRNLRRAADAIQMQQPAASRLLKSLEDTLDATLFTRTVRGMEPTPMGEFLITRAQATLASLKTLNGEIDDFSQGRRGSVRIGIVPSILSDRFSDVVRTLLERAPDLRFSIQQAGH